MRIADNNCGIILQLSTFTTILTPSMKFIGIPCLNKQQKTLENMPFPFLKLDQKIFKNIIGP